MRRRSTSHIVLLAAGLAACGSKSVSPTAPDTTFVPSAQQGCSRTSVGLTPLSEQGGTYQGQPLGLYPGGQNELPLSHRLAGTSLARAIGPIDAEGRASASGRYAFISIGMSNTTQEFSTFVPMANGDSAKDSHLVVVDGAQGGVTAADWIDPNCACWSELDRRIRQAGLTGLQVATAWVKLADRQPSSGWPSYARTLKDETVTLLRMLKSRFPNLQIAYLSSRIYAGYATSTLNPEPYAYESGFAARWVIEDQINGSLAFSGAGAQVPWIAWGPYLWADGVKPRADGLSWACDDFVTSDYTHPSTSGRQKVAQRLLDFVHTDSTAREWYIAQ
jgi:hypothetical protein